MPAAKPVTITFGVTVSTQLTPPQIIINTAIIDDALGNILSRQARVVVDGYTLSLPLIQKQSGGGVRR